MRGFDSLISRKLRFSRIFYSSQQEKSFPKRSYACHYITITDQTKLQSINAIQIHRIGIYRNFIYKLPIVVKQTFRCSAKKLILYHFRLYNSNFISHLSGKVSAISYSLYGPYNMAYDMSHIVKKFPIRCNRCRREMVTRIILIKMHYCVTRFYIRVTMNSLFLLYNII